MARVAIAVDGIGAVGRGLPCPPAVSSATRIVRDVVVPVWVLS
ncbi:hypothetical protein [Allorhizocola rhizosphaerae]|nr:hypothetical protein [Allorhizocola rhizosphaerae]